MTNKLTFLLILLFLPSTNLHASEVTSEFWKSATVYFMLTDRFNNGDRSNDAAYNRNKAPALLRGFEGGDIQGVIDKIEDGYFTRLGVDAIWMTPVIEQIHGYDESAGLTYAYHGYWPKDWTAVDANFGSEQDFARLVKTAHKHKIKVLVDVIINHTGPQTQEDWAWPEAWTRTRPICSWESYEQNTRCALATSLTDIKTESEAAVSLPPQLLEKWKREGRINQELGELDAFFERTGYPRAPKYYIVKWLTDWVRDYGVDGFRVDTVKHVEPQIWAVLKKESEQAFTQWKQNNPQDMHHDLPFYMVGEVMHWGMNGHRNTPDNTRLYNFGDKQVDYFDYGFDALINMGFVAHAGQNPEALFSSYAESLLRGPMKNKGILNYIGSHDDHDSYDRERKHNYETAFKLMMAPGAVQIYYGDEIARPMYAKDALGDAQMRTFMNWQDLSSPDTQALLSHWRKLGTFRQAHRAVGAGEHTMLSKTPYIFARTLNNKDRVLVATDLPKGEKTIPVFKGFENDVRLYDYYSQQYVTVNDDKVKLNSPFSYALLGMPKQHELHR